MSSTQVTRLKEMINFVACSLKAFCKVKKDLKTAHWNSQSKQIDVTYLKYFTE